MRSAVWALIGASVLWGTTGTAASFLGGAVSPLAVGASTMTIGGALLFALSARGSIAALRTPAVRSWLLLGAAGVVIYPLAFYSAMDLAGVAIGNVAALGSAPLFAAILERAIEGRRVTRRWMLGAATAIAGVTLLVVGSSGHRGSEEGDGSVGAGVGLGLLAGAAFALYTYCSGRVIALDVPSRDTMGAVFGLGAVPLSGVLALTGAPLLAGPVTISIVLYLALGPMLLAYVLFGTGLRGLRSSTVTVITLLEPLVATLLAVLIVGERLTSVGWVGLALILVGLAVVSTARRPSIAV